MLAASTILLALWVSAEKPRLDAPTETIQQVRRSMLRPPNPLFQTAGLETSRLPNFVYVEDVGRTLPSPPWGSVEPYGRAFALARRGWNQDQGDNVRGLMVITTFDEGGDTLFYIPLANDIEGLGIGDATRIFDETPGSPLDGTMWMGSLDVLDRAGDLFFTEAFVHEIAHRWSAYLQVDNTLLPQDGLLGRQDAHWSFLAHTEASPMEGNDWRPRDNNRYTTYFEGPHQVRFSPLDLYTMGVMPDFRVPDFHVIYALGTVQPSWYSAVPGSEPAHRVGVPVTLSQVQVAEVSIRDIISANGHRVPEATDGPMTWKIGVVLLSDGRKRASVATFRNLTSRLVELEAAFELAADNRIDLDLSVNNLPTLPLGAPCTGRNECIRTEADRCAPPETGKDFICTRQCATNESCGAGFCCMTHVGLQTPVCAPQAGPCPAFSLDGGASVSDGGLSEAGTGLGGNEEAGCGCSQTTDGRPVTALMMICFAWRVRRVTRRVGA